MAESTLNAAFRTRLLTDFFYNMANYNSFGERNITSGNESLAVTDQRGSANFRIVARDSGLQTVGSIDPYIPTTTNSGQDPNWEVQGTKLVYTGPAVEIDISQPTTVVDLLVQYRKVTVSSLTGNPTTVDTTFVLFPVNLVFAEANGKIVINNIEFELE
jgi:hypothetical protein